jgi:HPt (histidine-containing phosphotransfer) domain-containing protein
LPKPINQARLDSIIKEWIAGDIEAPILTSEQADKPDNTADITPDTMQSSGEIEIPGVDTEMGLYLFEDDKEMFLDFLKSYIEYIPDELNNLRSVSEDTLKDYAIGVHTVKGSSAGIGAGEVADFARRLEVMAKAGDLDGVLSENEKFLSRTEKLISDIQVFFKCMP